MAKGDDKRVADNIKASQNQTNNQQDQLWGQYNQGVTDTNAAGQNERNTILAGYGDFAKSGGVSEDEASRLRALYHAPGAVASGSPSGSSGSEQVSGSGQSVSTGAPGGGPSKDYWSTPEAGYNDLAATGGVDYNAMTEALPGFRELSGKEGGFDPNRLAAIGASTKGLGEIGATGGYDPTREGQVVKDLYDIRNLSATGGYNGDDLNRLRGTVQQLRDYGVSGGLSQEEIAKYNDPGYEEFAKSGGFSDKDLGNMRASATAPVTALNRQNLQQIEQAQRINPSGGSLAAAIAQSSRGNAQALADAARDQENSINEAVRQGRQWGIAGRANQTASLSQLLSQNRIGSTNMAATAGGNLEQNVANNRISALEKSATGLTNLEQNKVSNKIAGLTGSGTLDLNTQQAINNSRLGGLQGITNTSQGAGQIVQQGKVAGLGGLTNIADSRSAAQQASDARAAQEAEYYAGLDQSNNQFNAQQDLNERKFGAGIEQYLTDTGNTGKMGGLNGLSDMYTKTYGPGSEQLAYQNNLPGQQAQTNQGYIGDRISASQIPGKYQTALNNTLAVANGVGGLVGAFSGAPKLSSGSPQGGGMTTLPNSPVSKPYYF